MCRLYAFLANEPTKVECSLVYAQNALLQQSRADQTGRAHADGWGIVCYDEDDRWGIPSTVKHHQAAFEEPHFSRSAEKIYSKSVVAHVRLGTVGNVSTLNAHPFTYDEWTFAHNGTIPAFDSVRQSMSRDMSEHHRNCRLGTTDSELFFLWLLSKLEANDLNSQNIAEQEDKARSVLIEAIASLAEDCHARDPDEPAKLNFVLTNGKLLFACRWNNSLHQLVRQGVYDCEVCGIPHIHHSPSVDHRAVVIASEPISGEAWHEIPNYSLTYVSPNLTSVVDEIPHNNLAGSQ